MQLEEAHKVASRLVWSMRIFCDRVEIAGSIRRGKPEVKDIEIVAVPKWSELPDSSNLFGEKAKRVNDLHRWALTAPVPGEADLQWIKPGTSDIVPWTPQEKGRYWCGYFADLGIKLDLFLTKPENWGAIFLIRTGSAEFSQAVATHARRVGYRFQEGALCVGATGEAMPAPPVPEERDIFERLGLEYVEPKDRTGADAVRPIRCASAAGRK